MSISGSTDLTNERNDNGNTDTSLADHSRCTSTSSGLEKLEKCSRSTDATLHRVRVTQPKIDPKIDPELDQKEDGRV